MNEIEAHINNTINKRLEKAKIISNKITSLSHEVHTLLSSIENSKGTIAGATVENIIDLITEYELRNGKHPMSSKSIQEAFRPDKIKLGILPSIDFGKLYYPGLISKKKVNPESFVAKVQRKLYEILPLKDVLTDYEGTILRQGDILKFRIPPTLSSPAGVSLYADLVVDNRLAIETNQGPAAEEIASKIALEIMRTHLYKWKAFTARAFQYSENHLDVIYGVLEDKP